jgi:uncharacterized protein (TIGR00369 family)
MSAAADLCRTLQVPPGFPEPTARTRHRETLKAIISGQLPRSSCAAMLSLPRPASYGHGTLSGEVNLSDEVTWAGGVVFGGYAACLIDQFSALVMMTVLPDTASILTADISVSFSAPLRPGTAMIRASVRTVSHWSATVITHIDQHGTAVCVGTAHQVVRHAT